MTNKNKNTFERRPILTMIFINLFFLFIWLIIDLIYSNFISSFTHTYEILQSVKPVGHKNIENKTFRWVSRHTGEYDAEVKLNNLGFRNNEDFNEKSIKDKKVIFAIGDSTTAAFENSYESSYPKALNNILGDKYIIFNTGVRGFDTHQVVINYQTQLRQLKPDILIYMICENDLEGNINTELYPNIIRYYGKGIIENNNSFTYIDPIEGKERQKIAIKIFAAKNFQLTYKNIFMPLISLTKKYKPTVENEKNNFNYKELKKLEQLLLVLNNLTKEDNVMLFITWFPYLQNANEGNTTIPEYYKRTKKFVNEHLNNSFFIQTYEPLIQYYKEHPSTQDTEFLFPYNLHATDFGSVKLSKIIGDSLKQKLIIE